MFENLISIFKKNKKSKSLTTSSKDTAKERLHLVLMQDRANVSADFLDLMRKEIIEVIKKYIDIDEKAMDVRLTTETNEDGTQGAPALYANIPIINIKDETRKLSKTNQDHKIEIKLIDNKKENIQIQDKIEIEETEDNKDKDKEKQSDIQEQCDSIEEKENKNEDLQDSSEEEKITVNKKKAKDKESLKKHESQNKEEENNNEE